MNADTKEPSAHERAKERLMKRITEADIPGHERDLLTKRLKVANHAGLAHVQRDFEEAMQRKRESVLQSHRRGSQGLPPGPGVGRNKLCRIFAHM